MTANQETYQGLMDQGRTAALEQQWDQAAALFQSAINISPGQPDALIELGNAYYNLNQDENAIPVLKQACELNPENPEPFELISLIFDRNGKRDETIRSSLQAAELLIRLNNTGKAIDSFQRVLSIDPDNLIARTRLAMIFETSGMIIEAVKEYMATCKILAAAGHRDKAILAATYCEALLPASEEIKDYLSQLSLSPDQIAAPGLDILPTEDSLLPQSDIEPPGDPIAASRKLALEKMAEYIFANEKESPIQFSGDPGSRVFTGLPDTDGRQQTALSAETLTLIHLGKAIDAQTNHDDDLTAQELVKAFQAGLNHPAAFFFLGTIYAGQNNPDSIPCFERSVLSPDYALACYLSIALVHIAGNQHLEAARAFLSAFAVADASVAEPGLAEELKQSYGLYAASLEQQVNEGDVQHICDNIPALLMRPDWRNEILALRMNLPMHGPDSAAIPVIDLLIDPACSRIISTLATIRGLLDRGKVHSAMEEAFFAIDKAPAYLPMHILIGELLLQLGKTPDAIQKFYVVSQLYELRGERTRAIRLLSRVVQIAPMDITIRRKMIDLLVADHKPTEAIQHTINLAKMHYQLAELDLARQDYSAALRLSLESNIDRAISVEILYNIADIDMQRLDLRQALRVYEQIRTIEPGDTTARSHIVDMNFRLDQVNEALGEVDGFVSLLENSGKRLSAIEFLNGLITDYPDQLDLRKRLANIYVRSGRMVEAVQQLDAVAESLLTAGNMPGTIEMLKTIVALNPPNIAHYQAALDQISRKGPGQ